MTVYVCILKIGIVWFNEERKHGVGPNCSIKPLIKIYILYYFKPCSYFIYIEDILLKLIFKLLCMLILVYAIQATLLCTYDTVSVCLCE